MKSLLFYMYYIMANDLLLHLDNEGTEKVTQLLIGIFVHNYYGFF